MKLFASITPISEDLKEFLIEHLQIRTLKKREYLLRAGHVCRSICFIESGLLRCFYVKGESEICSWFMKEGDVIISIESFYSQTPGKESIQAIEDSNLYCIDYTQLQYIYRHFPEFNVIGRVLTEKYHVHWAQQLQALRMQQAGERYQWLMDYHSELLLRVPAKFIASYLGIEETTLSKIKSLKR